MKKLTPQEVIEGLKQEQMISAAPKMYKALQRLDKIGGLGLDNHDMIREALEAATYKQ